MTTLSATARDAGTMFRRDLRHQLRYPSVTVMLMAMPVVLLLLFVYVFGGTMGAGLAGPEGGRAEYLAYVVPGTLLLALAAVAQGTAISVAMDMTEGIVARFRTMAIARAAVLTGHVGGALVQSLGATVVAVGMALVLGFRPVAGPAGWLEALGLLGVIAFAITWLAVALGTRARSVESASNTPMFLFLLPFLGSGFVPTDSMPPVLRAFAEHQPFTDFNEALRAALAGAAAGAHLVRSLVWCALIAGLGYLLARSAYDRRSVVH